MNKIEEQFLLDAKELILVQEKHTDENKLLFAIMLKFFQIEGCHPFDKDIIDSLLISSLSTQLAISLPDDYEFNWNNRTIKRFRGEIRNFLGFKKASNIHVEKLISYLMEQAAPKCLTNEQYKECAYRFFKDQKLEPFSKNKIERYIATSIARFEHIFFSNICSLLSNETRDIIDNILKGEEIEPEDADNTLSNKFSAQRENKEIKQIRLWELKKDIAGAKLKLVEDELIKSNFLQNISLPTGVLSGFDRKLLLRYYHRVMALLPSHIKEYNTDAKYSMMAVFIYIRSQVITDNLAEVLLQLIHKMRTSAEAVIAKQIIKEVKCVNGKFDILHSLAKINATKPKGIIEEQVYPEVSQEKLKDLVKELDSRGNKWYQNYVQIKINSLYLHGSRTNILKLLDHFHWATNGQESKDLVNAIDFIKININSLEDYYPKTDQVPINRLLSKLIILVPNYKFLLLN